MCFCWKKDPEGVLGPPSTGHIARREFQRRLEKDAGAREEFKRQVLEEKERLRNLRAVIFFFYYSFASWLFVYVCVSWRGCDVLFCLNLIVLGSCSSGHSCGFDWVFSWYWSSGTWVRDCPVETSVFVHL